MRWPNDFGTRFTVFVDVEEEFDWSAPLDRAHRATTAMRAFPAAHARFADASVGLTCMVDYPIATDPAAIDILRAVQADGRSAIGAQLHPWVNPPHEEQVGAFTSFPGNLPRALQEAKLAALTDAIEQAFGERPVAFRAGRYGLGPDTFALLAAAGYRLDSSVRPGYDYRGEGGPDFRRSGQRAWHTTGLVELPLTTVFTGRLRTGGAALYAALDRLPRGRGMFSRAGLLTRVALTPEDMPIAAVLEAIAVATGEGLPLLAFSFHSPSLVPGHTPYVRDAADLATFWRWWDRVLDRLDLLGIRSASLAEILAAAEPHALPLAIKDR
ncbi:polysaccharide deacetylase family protein [Sphingomonas sp.]|uniref:polysaccharide deacetylase family protein n=1 Tax=Sphingomonas sp. TaxID=28214 RepID=UPI003B009924